MKRNADRKESIEKSINEDLDWSKSPANGLYDSLKGTCPKLGTWNRSAPVTRRRNLTFMIWKGKGSYYNKDKWQNIKI